MIAYDFLAKGALDPLLDFSWPEPTGDLPGAWLSARDFRFPSDQSGVRVCGAADLAHWLHDELWVLECDGDHRLGIDSLFVERARLVHRVDAWQLGGALRFALACAAHAAALADGAPATAVTTARGYIEDALAAAQAGYIGVSAHAAALAATLASIAVGIESNEQAAYRAERAWQSDWIFQHIILPHGNESALVV